MRVVRKLSQVNQVTKTMADGSRRTYYYAWKGGPRLQGEKGSPEFLASYDAALAATSGRAAGTLLEILRKYQDSPKFKTLAASTRRDYARHIAAIETEFGDMPVKLLSDPRSRGKFLDWRDKMAATSERKADYAFSVLAAILSWADRRGGLVPCNPCKDPDRVYRSARRETVWSEDDEAAFMAKAPVHLQLAFQLAVWTGQRQGDLLRLRWSDYDGTTIRLKQGKTGARVHIPVGAPLKAMLDATKREAKTILATTRKTAWTPDGFRSSWAEAVALSKVVGKTFHDLRGTAVTRLALAGCTSPEIGAITGHALKDVDSILHAHYLARDPKLAASAIAKREKHEEKRTSQLSAQLVPSSTDGQLRESPEK